MANKIQFYSLHYNSKTKKKELRFHKGYTDNVYNYYGRKGVWFAVDPDTGVSFAQANSSKEVRKKAYDPNTQKKLQKVKQTARYCSFLNLFNTLLKEKGNSV